jgi:hypothetical protein
MVQVLFDIDKIHGKAAGKLMVGVIFVAMSQKMRGRAVIFAYNLLPAPPWKAVWRPAALTAEFAMATLDQADDLICSVRRLASFHGDYDLRLLRQRQCMPGSNELRRRHFQPLAGRAIVPTAQSCSPQAISREVSSNTTVKAGPNMQTPDVTVAILAGAARAASLPRLAQK